MADHRLMEVDGLYRPLDGRTPSLCASLTAVSSFIDRPIGRYGMVAGRGPVDLIPQEH